MKDIRNFVDNYMLARDAKAFRDHIKATQPDIQMKFDFEGPDGTEEDATVPMTATFFWPDA
jgi:hypothetical protein